MLVGGAWGFACDSRLSAESARARPSGPRAFAQAAPGGHDRGARARRAGEGAYRTPVEKDPFAISLADKVELCLRAERGMQHDGRAR